MVLVIITCISKKTYWRNFVFMSNETAISFSYPDAKENNAGVCSDSSDNPN